MVKGWFVYGNYIDEVLAKSTSPMAVVKFYIHDHLYSPVALTDFSGNVLERYEYDAYGKPAIWNADFTTERANSNYGNPYLFTGRRVDIMDSGSLKIQYNRNRYYDYYTGRWLTQDPLGYVDVLNLYEYVRNDPVNIVDPHGFMSSVVVGGKKAWIILLSLQGLTVEEIATKVGLPIAVVAAILVAKEIEIPSPSPPITKPAPIVKEPEPIPKTSPKPIPFCPIPLPKECKPNTGDCSEEQYKDLVAKKLDACNKKFRCTDWNLTEAEIEERMRRAIRCFRARKRIIDECFKGIGDKGHREALENIRKAYIRCRDRREKMRRRARSRRRRPRRPRTFSNERPMRINQVF